MMTAWLGCPNNGVIPLSVWRDRVTLVFGVLVVALVAVGCATTSTSTGEVTVQPATAAESTPASATPTFAAPTVGVATTPAARQTTPTPEPVEFGTPLPPAPIGVDAAGESSPAPRPVSLVIDELDISAAPVVPVGVNPDDTLEVPAADEVGWYQFGPTPGVDGSSVLAAHIAYDGVDGVFRSLADIEAGAEVVVGFDDGSSERFRIVSVTDYFKDELPDSLFAREGDPQLVLITCGGGFNRDLRSYDSNTVAVAIPV